ncbi:hypothetical protein C8D79_1147 [Bacteriovorax stolpii]|nr:hypothetical protein [Bacteriovorax stolpii]TDP53869.1 hypothetical protein C8D79_1147 [Bacteriovorax stolpii]BDT26631.1 hypothetical protein BHI3_00970 [Bacteriovorax sp. HI3]
MNLLQDDLHREFNRIKLMLENGQPLTDEDLKIILLAELNEEDLHESKQ